MRNMVKSAWYDVSYRGRRLEQVSKLCMANIVRLYEKGDVDSIELMFSYMDRFLKVEQSVRPYIEEYLGVKKLIKENAILK